MDYHGDPWILDLALHHVLSPQAAGDSGTAAGELYSRCSICMFPPLISCHTLTIITGYPLPISSHHRSSDFTVYVSHPPSGLGGSNSLSVIEWPFHRRLSWRLWPYHSHGLAKPFNELSH